QAVKNIDGARKCILEFVSGFSPRLSFFRLSNASTETPILWLLFVVLDCYEKLLSLCEQIRFQPNNISNGAGVFPRCRVLTKDYRTRRHKEDHEAACDPPFR